LAVQISSQRASRKKRTLCAPFAKAACTDCIACHIDTHHAPEKFLLLSDSRQYAFFLSPKIASNRGAASDNLRIPSSDHPDNPIFARGS
jgi:hypothetical protein